MTKMSNFHLENTVESVIHDATTHWHTFLINWQLLQSRHCFCISWKAIFVARVSSSNECQESETLTSKSDVGVRTPVWEGYPRALLALEAIEVYTCRWTHLRKWARLLNEYRLQSQSKIFLWLMRLGLNPRLLDQQNFMTVHVRIHFLSYTQQWSKFAPKPALQG